MSHESGIAQAAFKAVTWQVNLIYPANSDQREPVEEVIKSTKNYIKDVTQNCVIS